MKYFEKIAAFNNYTLNKLIDMMSKEYGIPKHRINSLTSLRGLYLDKADMVEGLMKIEKEFNVEITDHEASSLGSLGALQKLIDKKAKPGSKNYDPNKSHYDSEGSWVGDVTASEASAHWKAVYRNHMKKTAGYISRLTGRDIKGAKAAYQKANKLVDDAIRTKASGETIGKAFKNLHKANDDLASAVGSHLKTKRNTIRTGVAGAVGTGLYITKKQIEKK